MIEDKRKVFICELCNGLEILSSKALQNKLILNIDNDTGEMAPESGSDVEYPLFKS